MALFPTEWDPGNNQVMANIMAPVHSNILVYGQGLIVLEDIANTSLILIDFLLK